LQSQAKNVSVEPIFDNLARCHFTYVNTSQFDCFAGGWQTTPRLGVRASNAKTTDHLIVLSKHIIDSEVEIGKH
jgi:hypothetical protein